MADIRPLRDLLENNITDEVPEGPLGTLGEGNLIGFAGFLAVESGQIITIPIPGLNRPGFKIVSNSLVDSTDGKQIHDIVLHAASEDVAEFVTQYESSPSNFDFIRGDTEVLDIEELDADGFYSTYRVRVMVNRRAIREELAD